MAGSSGEGVARTGQRFEYYQLFENMAHLEFEQGANGSKFYLSLCQVLDFYGLFVESGRRLESLLFTRWNPLEFRLWGRGKLASMVSMTLKTQ